VRRFFLILLMLLSSSAAWAEDEKLWPTMLKSLGDCVTPRISAARNPMQDGLDREYCEKNNEGDVAKIKTCIENSASNTQVDFFTDRCAETEGVFYISLNGRDYTLRRVGENLSGTAYAGKYIGAGMTVEVVPGKLLSREFTPPEEGEPREIISEEYAVTVKITRSGRTDKIDGVFWQGR
jgi:hypothetical protein